MSQSKAPSPKLTKRDMKLMSYVMEYFSDRSEPLAPSQIDAVMGIRPGLAHDLIVRFWYDQKMAANAITGGI